MCRISIADAGGANVCAFLDMLAWSEIGPAMLAKTDDGYNVLVGSTAHHLSVFDGYDDHPQIVVKLSDTLHSSAAGRYQFLAKTWDGLVDKLHLSDFSPVNQDRGCIELLRECKAFPQIVGGNIEGAIRLACKTWASLPGAGYNQPEHTLSNLLGAFSSYLAHYRADFANVESGSATTAPGN